MKYSRKILVGLLGISLMFFVGIPAFGQEWSAEQKEVWKMEMAYWDSFKEGDMKRHMELWHKDFIGWPKWAEKPIGKGEMEMGQKSLSKFSTYEVKDKTIKIINNVAIVFYNYNFPYGHSGVITHIWMKQDGKWQIISGSSRD